MGGVQFLSFALSVVSYREEKGNQQNASKPEEKLKPRLPAPALAPSRRTNKSKKIKSNRRIECLQHVLPSEIPNTSLWAAKLLRSCKYPQLKQVAKA